MVFESGSRKVERLIWEAIAVGIIEVAFIVYFIFEIIRKSKE